jgi:hypothetical protein
MKAHHWEETGLRLTNKLESFWELQISAESGSLTNFLLAKPLYEATKGKKWELLVWGRKILWKIKKTLTSAPTLGLPEVMSHFSCMSITKENSHWGPDSITGLLSLIGGLPVKTTWWCFLRLAALPACPSIHCCLGDKSRQAHPRTKTHYLGSPLRPDTHGV